MRIVELDPAPAVIASAFVLGAGADLATVAGESPLRFRRMDRFAALGYTAARVALARAQVAPQGQGDPEWGVIFGSSTGCWTSIAEFFANVRGARLPELSPALFAQTVSNAVNGEISIAHQLGGASQTHVSGWTAGAEAIAEAGSLIAEGRSRCILAGGVEAPDETVRTMVSAAHAERAAGWIPPALEECAGALLLAGTDSPAAAGCLRLRAFARGRDPRGAWSLREVTRQLGCTDGRVVVAGAVAPEVLARWRSELRDLDSDSVPPNLGASGPVAGVECLGSSPGVVVARGWEGSTVVLALAP